MWERDLGRWKEDFPELERFFLSAWKDTGFQDGYHAEQSKQEGLDELRAAYAQAQVDANVVDFIDDMASAYAQADVVICRAGAITVSELTAAGVASVLVPLVASTTSHQRDNAQWMAKQGASIHMPQSELNPQSLAALLQTLLARP